MCGFCRLILFMLKLAKSYIVMKNSVLILVYSTTREGGICTQASMCGFCRLILFMLKAG